MDIATSLLEYGAKANAESKAGFTPLHLACQEGHTDMASLLIRFHADVNAGAKVSTRQFLEGGIFTLTLDVCVCLCFSLPFSARRMA